MALSVVIGGPLPFVSLEDQIYLTTVHLAGLIELDECRVDESRELLVCVLARSGFTCILGRVGCTDTFDLFGVALPVLVV